MSESEEMYLVTLAQLTEAEGDGPTSVARLAKELEVLPVSVNQMIHKLEESGWVVYTQYKGVTFTETGKGQAISILRRRRLWEVFLVERLHFLPDEAESLACSLEHAVPDEAIERLADYIGQPVVNPKGLPIPASESDFYPVGSKPVAACIPGEELEIIQVAADGSARAFLAEESLFPAQRMRLLAVSSKGVYLIQNCKGESISLSLDLAKKIWVKGVS